MTASRFEECLKITLHWEGGYSNILEDPGGPTMRGVIQRVYDGYRDSERLPRRPVQEIERAEWEAIYRANYWRPVRAEELPAGVDLAAWDYCVNAGPTQAVKSLQRVLGVTVDGHFGAATLGALQRREPQELIAAYLEERRRFHRSLKTFWRFGKGWLRRCDGIEAKAIEMAGPVTLDNVAAIVSAPAPLPDPAAQSATQGRATPTPPAPPAVTELTLATTGILSGAQGFSNGFAKVAAMAEPTAWSVALAFLSEPLVFTAVATMAAALTTYLWRRAHA